MKHICLQCALLAGAMMLGASPANAEMRPHHWQVKRPVATVAAANRAASVVAFGQHRALVVWQRIIMPDGSSLKIDNVAATDAAGYAGLADKVDFHTWTLLKGVAISTLLGVGSTLGFTGGSDLVSAIRQAAQQNVARASDQLTSRNLQVQPTITIRPGTPVRLVVHRDLILEPWKE